ncbi:pilin [Mycoplasmopsis cynos]|uniref:Mbov_0395 family pilin-like conjugal transfer protein n=2 Tax=Mycoplasmopsis cynos TaxID=171284 RepID=UPI0024C54C7D|nr:hypothetical protein [Mycoplasmopsis cynos]MCU9936605.1 pilin [Mycoplasmopsis cynos]WAM04016.1 pilin [Mycoplasmopsis cynos]
MNTTIYYAEGLANSEQSFNTTIGEVWKIINIVGGALLGIAVLWCLGAIILSFVQNSHTSDPQKKKLNNLKIFWAVGAIVAILFFWGIASIVLASVGGAKQNVNPFVSGHTMLNSSTYYLKNSYSLMQLK